MMSEQDVLRHHQLIEKLEKKAKSLNQLPKLKQDVIKSITQIGLNKKYDGLVESIIQRKLSEKK
tara:strand:+ start:316 stop:507 length:192 start_codon:yes stop_codon:yes gene_type:complete